MLCKVVNRIYNSCLAEGKYCRKYDIGTVVTAVPGTYGLMIFSDIRWAKSFVDMWESKIAIILEVKGIGEKFEPLDVCGYGSEFCIDHFYSISNPRKSDFIIPKVFAPMGTVCYPKVRVLREISQN